MFSATIGVLITCSFLLFLIFFSYFYVAASEKEEMLQNVGIGGGLGSERVRWQVKVGVQTGEVGEEVGGIGEYSGVAAEKVGLVGSPWGRLPCTLASWVCRMG